MLKKFINNNRLLRTTAVRISLRYAFYFTVVMVLGLGSLYWTTSQYIDAQITANLENQLDKLINLHNKKGQTALIKRLNEPVQFTSSNHLFYLLTSASGKKIAGNLNAWPNDVANDKVVRNIWIDSQLISEQFPDNDGYWPVIATKLANGEKLLLTQSIVQAEDLREFTLFSMLTIAFFSIGLILLLGWRLSKRMFYRIDHINQIIANVGLGRAGQNETNQIEEGYKQSAQNLLGSKKLSQRLPLTGKNDEFDELSNHLNAMLLRLELLVNGMHEVSDNIAHDLRSPLTRLHNRIENALSQINNSDLCEQTLTASLNDIDNLLHTFNALLEISQVESGSFNGEFVSLNISAATQMLAELYKDSAQEQQINFLVDIAPNIIVIGNKHLLMQAISNILDNALKHTPINGTIKITLSENNNEVTLSISDTGAGISVDDYEHVLQRFVQLDKSRNTKGNGLGLSLVKAIADLHKAQLIFQNNQPGLTVLLVFKQ